MMVVAVHVVVIGGMLLQGCKDTSNKDQVKTDNSTSPSSDTTPMAAAPSNTMSAPATAPADVPSTLNPNLSNAVAGTAPTAAPAPQPSPMTTVAPQPATAAGLNPPGATTEYVIAKGDTLGAIARKNGISLKTLMEANPGVNPKKLKVGQKVQVPGGAAAEVANAAPGAASEAAADGGVYVVKSGDILLKIARAHGTTVKKIMAMNDLKTTSIRAGQKLKLPAPKTAAPDASAAPASAFVAPAQPAAAPMKVSAGTPAMPSPVASN
jgi:LysM repeat protein